MFVLKKDYLKNRVPKNSDSTKFKIGFGCSQITRTRNRRRGATGWWGRLQSGRLPSSGSIIRTGTISLLECHTTELASHTHEFQSLIQWTSPASCGHAPMQHLFFFTTATLRLFSGIQLFTFGIPPPTSFTNMFGSWLNGSCPKLRNQILLEATALCWIQWICGWIEMTYWVSRPHLIHTCE